MRAARADANMKDIVEALRVVGATVRSLHRVGGGVPDLLVGYRSQNYLLECKAEDGTLTPQQIDFGLTWKGRPMSIVHSEEEALKAIGAIGGRP
jgi:hypothetical protein